MANCLMYGNVSVCKCHVGDCAMTAWPLHGARDMKMHHAIAAVLLTSAVTGFVACDEGTSTGVQEGASTELQVDWEPADESLYSGSLRKKICRAIVAAEGPGNHDGECTGFTYTVTRFGRSKLYQHKGDSRPVTMKMDVTVENPEDGASYEATLTRQLTTSLQLGWSADVAVTSLQEKRRFIRDIADAAGEYGDFDDPDVAQSVEWVTLSELPADLQARAEEAALNRAELNCQWWAEEDEVEGDCPNGAGLADDHLIIRMNGEVVGYMFHIWDGIDHPLWDGSGVRVYVDENFERVTSVDWTG